MAFVWDLNDPAQDAEAGEIIRRMSVDIVPWYGVLRRDGLRVYEMHETCGGDRDACYCAEGGLVLGTLFTRDDDSVRDGVVPIRAAVSVQAGMFADAGRALVCRYWGNYVAFIPGEDPGHDELRILRGPASTLPCLHTLYKGVHVVFSLVEDCVRLGIGPFTIDWNYLAARMVSLVPGVGTGLQEVTRIRPGECLQILSGQLQPSRQAYWSAQAVARQATVEDVDAAAACLRRTVQRCVDAWAGCHDEIIHNLSGGLDSTIVLACLIRAPSRPRITCVTHYSPGADSDEREYARMAVARFGCARHIEQLRNGRFDLGEMMSARLSAWPQVHVRRVELARSQAAMAREFDATAVFSGSGGDAIFHQSSAQLTATDFLWTRGLRPDLARIVYHAAQLESLSVWRVFGSALHDWAAPRHKRTNGDAHSALLDSQRVQAMRRAYLCDAGMGDQDQTLAPGKALHASTLSIVNDYYDPMGRAGDPERVAPLMSQPLIEAALRIPTYVLMTAGWDRGLARRAFATELPEGIARRRSKGGIEEHMIGVLRFNLPFIRKMLLDGVLVEHKLLDAARLDEVLQDRPSGIYRGTADIFSHLSTEVWARQWQ